MCKTDEREVFQLENTFFKMKFAANKQKWTLNGLIYFTNMLNTRIYTLKNKN